VFVQFVDKMDSPVLPVASKVDEDLAILALKELWKQRKSQKGLHSVLPVDNNLLRRFIISKKTPERAIEPLVKFVEFRNALPWDKYTWETLEAEFRIGWVQGPYPVIKCVDGSILAYAFLTGYYPEKIGTDKIKLMVWMIAEILQQEEDHQRAGFTLVQDVKGLSWDNWHVETEHALTDAFQDCFPIIVKKMLLVNANMVLKAVLTIAKTWMKEKLQERIQIIRKKELELFLGVGRRRTEFGGEAIFNEEEQMVQLRAFWLLTCERLEKNKTKPESKNKG